MDDSGSSIRNISDTAAWAAVYRARETDRADALFRDPLARRLAGPRGEAIAAGIPRGSQQDWAWSARTVLFDRMISEAVGGGADTVINLAAGLDARPYRMALPRDLRWIEVDLPGLQRYKQRLLADERPRCSLERVELDLAAVPERRRELSRIGSAARHAVVVTEGLLIYLDRAEVEELGRDLLDVQKVDVWLVDIVSPGLLKMLQRQIGGQLEQAGAPLRFGPVEGPGFFASCGWRATAVESLLKTAASLGRLSLVMRLFALLPESKGHQGSRPWSAVCRLERSGRVA